MSDVKKENLITSESNENPRRRVLKGMGIGASLVALPSRTVWATTGMAHSVVASNHGSAFAQPHDYELIQPGNWKQNKSPNVNLNHKKYVEAFGYPIEIDEHTSFYNGIGHIIFNEVTLAHVLGKLKLIAQYYYSLAKQRSSMQLLKFNASTNAWEPVQEAEVKGSFTYNSAKNYIVRHVDGADTHERKLSEIRSDYMGYDEINKLLVSAYLNAANNTDIPKTAPYFPAVGVNQTTGRHYAYPNMLVFGQTLHSSRLTTRLRNQLDALHRLNGRDPSQFHTL